MVSTTTTLPKLPSWVPGSDRAAMRARARIRDGNDSMMSIARHRQALVAPPEEPGGDADQPAEEEAEHEGADADAERHAVPPQHAGEHVPAQLVGAEQVLGASGFSKSRRDGALGSSSGRHRHEQR